MKKIISLIAIVLLLCGCSTAHLTTGEESVVTFDEGGIAAEDLFKILKEKYGINELITLIDTELLEREYDVTDDENKYITDVIKSLKNEWQDDFLKNAQSYYGVTSENEMKDFIRLSYRRNQWISDYAETQVNETQINDYYNTVTIGDMDISHILISVNSSSTMTSDELSSKEKEAFDKATDLINRLNNGEDFANLAKEVSDDTTTASKGGSLGSVNYDDNLDENFMDSAVKLEVGKYTTTPVKSSYGYHIIYKTSQAEKPTLEDSKEEIVSAVAKELLEEDSTLYTKYILALREKYGIKITDSNLKNQYDEQYKTN